MSEKKDTGRKNEMMLIYFPRWVVAQEKAASDPYNVINYGIGGQIEVGLECYVHSKSMMCTHEYVDCWSVHYEGVN